MFNHEDHTASNVLLGMATGAVIGAGGMLIANQNRREMQRAAKKLARGAGRVVDKVDTIVSDLASKM